MKRVLVGLLVLGLLVSSVGMASAGGRRHHHGPSDAYWWVLGAGVAWGTLGVFAGRPYYPAYPPVIVTQPRVVTCPYQLFIRSEIACFFLAPGPCWRAMKKLWQALFHKLTTALRDRLELVLTVMALRHQLAVLERSGKRPHFSPADRCFWVLLSTIWARWSTVLTIVHADTVRRWTRQGVRYHLAWQRRRQRPGRPALAAETRMLIRRISRENRLWGAPRLHGELTKLGICLSRTTVAKYMARRPRIPSPTWRTFMRHHVYNLIASGADVDLARRLYTSYVKVMSTLPRWLSSWTTQGGQRPSRRDVVSCPQRSDPASVPFVWAPDLLDRIGVPARSPPDFQSSDHDVPAPASVPRAGGTAHVCLASPPIGCWGVHLFLHRQGNRSTTGQARGVSRPVAA
jgi:hypothetical protein